MYIILLKVFQPSQLLRLTDRWSIFNKNKAEPFD